MRGTNNKVLRTKQDKRLFGRLTDQEKCNIRFMLQNRSKSVAEAIIDMKNGDYNLYFDWYGKPLRKRGKPESIRPKLTFESVGRILY